MTAAALHLGNLPTERLASWQEIRMAPRFDTTKKTEIGRLMLMGHDDHDNEVYVLGLGPGHRQLKYVLQTCLQLLGVENNEFCLVNCLPCVNLATRIGGFLSRSVGCVWLGRPLVTWGIWRNYHKYVQMVAHVQAATEHSQRFLDWFPPL